MIKFLQIILISLVVSLDNVGVIALSTRHLAAKQAKAAQYIGICLSFLLKMLFIIITGYLFQIPWLHIRIIGGILLLYVTYHLLKNEEHGSNQSGEKRSSNSLLWIIISITAADISMSLDNVIAILSIVSVGQSPAGLIWNWKDLAVIFAGLLVCIPLLLWFSGKAARLMERYRFISCLCAGYLVYTAIHMIFQDETLKVFFDQIHFTAAMPAAILLGVFAALYGIFTSGLSTRKAVDRRKRTLLLTGGIVVFALLKVAFLSYLSTGPEIQGIPLDISAFYHLVPTGANAVYSLGSSSLMIALCAAVFTGFSRGGRLKYRSYSQSFFTKFYYTARAVTAFLAIEFAVSTIGMTVVFGFGTLQLYPVCMTFLLQVLLHYTYAAVFCLLSVFISSRAAGTAFGILYILIESTAQKLLEHSSGWSTLAGLFPGYYISMLSGRVPGFAVILSVLFTVFIYIAIPVFLCNLPRCASRWQISLSGEKP